MIGLARAFAIVRGVMLVVFCLVLIAAPEKALAGSSTEPARSLAWMVASRTILLGTVLVVLAIRRKQRGLGWVLLADAALQIFDVGMALAMHKGALGSLQRPWARWTFGLVSSSCAKRGACEAHFSKSKLPCVPQSLRLTMMVMVTPSFVALPA